MDELSRLLGLAKPPMRIESYDISNLAGGENVAGMVVFQNGKPLKSDYRKFKIKGFEGQDDYASMREVIQRRFGEYVSHQEQGNTEGFGQLPDLILLDGGKGHVAAVRPVIESFGLNIPLFGMVKDDKHRTRAITGDGGEISIHSHRRAFILVSTIQDEVHRFAIGYHRQQRKKKTLASESDPNPWHWENESGGTVPIFPHLILHPGCDSGGIGRRSFYEPAGGAEGIRVLPSG